jgi:sialic acid synthase SpsE
MSCNKTFIIAEAGVNHNGSLELAMKLIDIASEASADAVKFQTFKAEKVISGYAQKAAALRILSFSQRHLTLTALTS